MKTTLNGITWNHSRGIVPMVSTSQRFMELKDEVEISWSKRSLQEFADQPLDGLADDFDLLIIDHPWVGYVSKTEILLALDSYLSPQFLSDQKENSVGKSFKSYTYGGHQWALPIDVATPVASSRPDILNKLNVGLPSTFQELLALAEDGAVVMPSIPIDSLMNFYMFCLAFGEYPFENEQKVVSEQIGLKALKALRSLASKIDSACFDWNPIAVYEAMTQTDKFAYCPFAYSYVNYARKGFSANPLRFHDLVAMEGSEKLISTLGGTGLAVSNKCEHKALACEFVKYAVSPEVQSSLYFESGGQPGHKKAWTSDHTNKLAGDFFKKTLGTHERAYLRPRYSGYMHFQDNAGFPIRDYIINGGDEKNILKKINQIYKESLQ